MAIAPAHKNTSPTITQPVINTFTLTLTMNHQLLQALKSGRTPQLRPVEIIQETRTSEDIGTSSRPERAQDAETSNDQQAKEYFFQAGMDAWVDACPPGLTLETYIVPLNRDDARALMAASSIRSSSSSLEEEKDATITPNEAILQKIEQRLENCMMDHDFKESGCFVKLTTRSPKDSAVAKTRARQIFSARRIAGEFGPPTEKFENIDDHSLRWSVFGEDMRQALKVHDGKGALDLLLSSERVYEDLKYALDEVVAQNEDEASSCHHHDWHLAMAVRKWDDRCTPQREFRAFVWNGQLTCVGQYFSLLRFECLQDPSIMEQVERDARAIFERIKAHAPVPSYMMDLVLLGGPSSLSVEDSNYLIEINPFDGVGLGTYKASTGLFDWDQDRDIMTGRKPFEVRLQHNPLATTDLKRLRPSLNKEWWNVIYN